MSWRTRRDRIDHRTGQPVRYELIERGKGVLPTGLRMATEPRKQRRGFHSALVQTPYGDVKGWAYNIGEEVHHGTDFDSAVKILESGVLRVGHTTSITGGHVTSFTSNPRQFNGNIRFIFNTRDMDIEPMVYARVPMDVEKGFGKEADKYIPETNTLVGINRVRGFYGVQPTIYKKEMESFTRENMGIFPHLKRVEYWIPYRFGSVIATADAHGVLPSYANVTDKDPMLMVSEVTELRAIADKFNIPFVVKSGFRSMHLQGWHQYAPLDKHNLNLIKEGIVPEATLTESIEGFKMPYRVVSSD